ncbi:MULTISPECIES: DUF2242 domain-containing protein [Pseudomonas]|uniref:DUF2242 domain-containing protein n=1 Tax=Pseudomonas TaxID=286 RepID=UPI001BE63304|nr:MULTISPECIES: DUF2242 domain-containing protein [Pseudomonas]MBT2339117.1 DUF2242 domain-containing protein [Pseudomonas fluorescens]MCD4528215.1 DUF2242 domain-containing protein [Pseudomonas sp. C3-2018]
MFTSFHMRTLGLALALLAAAGCSSKKTAVYEHESFDDSGTFSRTYPVSDTATCEAGRRALLSQGYIITSSDPKLVSGHKSFQQTGESHLEISFNLVCAEDGGAGHRATMFANALQDRYALKKTNNSASLGVGVLGSVSMPIGSSDDAMVKVASETVSAAKFYERFFALVEVFLPPEAKKNAVNADKPKAELGVPETKGEPAALAPASEPQPAPAPAPAAPADTAAPAGTAPAASEPVAPPSEPAPIAPAEYAPPVAPESTMEVITPPPASHLPAPTESIQPLPSY